MALYSEFLLEQAARCRRLAAEAHDEGIAKRLRELATEYETRAVAEDAGFSQVAVGPAPHLGKH